MSTVFDNRQCTLGEGPLWHPQRQQLFWFDVIGKQLLSRDADKALFWQFDEPVSAAGWVDYQHLFIASESSLNLFNIDDGQLQVVTPLEADNPITRSNDGRADPWGGFWIGTMGKNAEVHAGSIYRYYKGEVKKLFGDITITNAICFDPKGRWAYFTDTSEAKIWRQPLEKNDGWPKGDPSLYLDLKIKNLNPDGAVCDAQGNFWVALWGSSQVACFNEAGALQQTIDLPVEQPSCPAFGGENFDQLFITTATQDLTPEQFLAQTLAGQTFIQSMPSVIGQAEHQVSLK